MVNKNIIRLFTVVLILLQVFVPSSGVPAGRGANPRTSPYPFLKIRLNKIQNSAAGMEGFYKKLHILKSQDAGKITIFHIGDSHIQADFMTGVIRESLQADLGNAGRGLIFPYGLAKTNGPGDPKMTSNVVWRAQRSSWPVGDMPTGINGFAISTSNPGATIDIAFSDNTSAQNVFNKITLYCEKGPEAFEFQIAETTDAYDTLSLTESTPYTVTFTLSAPTSHIRLAVRKTKATQRHAVLYGISLENGKEGILYHTAGVNGASFKTFNESAYFIPHLNILKPDLVIISLGSNDVGESDFDPATFRAQIDELVQSILKDNPDVSILLTLPPDFGKAGNTLLRQKMSRARNVMIGYCKRNGQAYWDLYMVMGGYGSIGKWQKSSLVQKDAMHFRKAGYQLQGRLFFQALMKGLRDYESNRLE
ncbi:MAG: GDSL-like Lipase/Acylhydrolase [Syntrophorhabdus sp. PtaU1.Bin058]|nr:MAG: GDSL-like Lipase/Acylhydrolase [Syntrophorhabdus sp. PtaU1.Bin058]